MVLTARLLAAPAARQAARATWAKHGLDWRPLTRAPLARCTQAVATLATERDFAALGIARDWFAVRRAALSGAEEGSLDRYLVGRWARPREAPERPGTSKDGGDNAKDELAQLNRHLRGAQRCSLLGPGSAFVGSQVFSNNPAHGRDERWKVSVRITEADVERGLLRGVMDAVNQHRGGTSGVRCVAPRALEAVSGPAITHDQPPGRPPASPSTPCCLRPRSTFWEGEVLDGDRVGLLTGRLGATAQVDRVHWARFPPVERMLARIRAGEDPDPTDLSRYLLMRWKETFFVASPSEVRAGAGRSGVVCRGDGC